MEQYVDNLVINHPYTQKLHKQPYRMCTKSVMDTSDPWITFDEEGVSSHVRHYENYAENVMLTGKAAKAKTQEMVSMLKQEGKGKEYDCIMGLSGGVDSSYLAYYATKILGLRPLVVHVDAGWNSELAVNNIQSIIQKLDLDLHTLVIDWEEMRDLQLAFFKSSIANLDVPQDHVFIASLYQEAKRYNIKYILNGGNMSTESILPNAWGYDASDSLHVLDIHKKFGAIPLKTYPVFTPFKRFFYYPHLVKMKTLRPLEYINYNKAEVKEFLIKELGWRDYGGKHYESTFTKFFQAHYLPKKFGFDKRKAHLSSLIVSGQMTREDALKELKEPLYDLKELEEDRIFFAKKLGISLDEYYSIMNKAPSDYTDFANVEKYLNTLRKVTRKLSFVKRIIKR